MQAASVREDTNTIRIVNTVVREDTNSDEHVFQALTMPRKLY